MSAITAVGGRALAVECDVADHRSVDRAVATTTETFGGLDIVVANAGTTNPKVPIVEIDPTEFRRVLDVNLLGLFHCVCADRARIARCARGGHFVVMGSGAGRRAGPGFGPYSTSKAGAAMFVRILAQELRADSIAVNEIVPSPVNTRLAGARPVARTSCAWRFRAPSGSRNLTTSYRW